MSGLQQTAQLDELYRLYGIAAHNCSNIEYRIVFLLLGPKWTRARVTSPETVRKVYEDLQRKTLGQLLKEYKEHFAFTEQQIALMKEVLEKRNYLTHHFFGTYGKDMHDPEVQKKMIAELKELAIMFQSVSQSLQRDT